MDDTQPGTNLAGVLDAQPGNEAGIQGELGREVEGRHLGEESGDQEGESFVICKHWAQKGFCFRAGQCRFVHQGKGMDLCMTKSDVIGGLVQITPSRHRVSKTLCRHWSSKGYCNGGTRCNFSHNLEGEQTKSVKPPKKQPQAVGSNYLEMHVSPGSQLQRLQMQLQQMQAQQSLQLLQNQLLNANQSQSSSQQAINLNGLSRSSSLAPQYLPQEPPKAKSTALFPPAQGLWGYGAGEWQPPVEPVAKAGPVESAVPRSSANAMVFCVECGARAIPFKFCNECGTHACGPEMCDKCKRNEATSGSSSQSQAAPLDEYEAEGQFLVPRIPTTAPPSETPNRPMLNPTASAWLPKGSAEQAKQPSSTRTPQADDAPPSSLSADKCYLCGVGINEAVCLPCGHMCVCQACNASEKKITQCPRCFAPVESLLVIKRC